jgi:hypothetical protein
MVARAAEGSRIVNQFLMFVRQLLENCSLLWHYENACWILWIKISGKIKDSLCLFLAQIEISSSPWYLM